MFSVNAVCGAPSGSVWLFWALWASVGLGAPPLAFVGLCGALWGSVGLKAFSSCVSSVWLKAFSSLQCVRVFPVL